MRRSFSAVARRLNRLERDAAERQAEAQVEAHRVREQAVEEWRQGFYRSLSLDVKRRLRRMIEMQGAEPPEEPPADFPFSRDSKEQRRL